MSLLVTPSSDSYALLDSGEGMKLERFGSFVLSRPDPEALWPKRLPEAEWEQADAVYTRKGASGSWKTRTDFPKQWTIAYGGLSLELRPTSFKHVGLFPEQLSHWQWLAEKIAAAQKAGKGEIRALNLFAYTGGATLALAKAGASVTHVDSSKVAIDWARQNAALSGLEDAPVRWIEDDALKFLRREQKRGNKYDVIVMDPPAFGHGAGSALWKIERDFYELFALAKSLLSDTPVAFVVNGYTAGYSPLTLLNNVRKIADMFGGTAESGELAVPEEGSERLLPAGVFARWSAAN